MRATWKWRLSGTFVAHGKHSEDTLVLHASFECSIVAVLLIVYCPSARLQAHFVYGGCALAIIGFCSTDTDVQAMLRVAPNVRREQHKLHTVVKYGIIMFTL